MNVGMTRALRKLLLVGDSSTLCRHPFFGELLAYVKGTGATEQRLRWLNSFHLNKVFKLRRKNKNS
jgi:superfamily I DNA and/or RNA helicase